MSKRTSWMTIRCGQAVLALLMGGAVLAQSPGAGMPLPLPVLREEPQPPAMLPVPQEVKPGEDLPAPRTVPRPAANNPPGAVGVQVSPKPLHLGQVLASVDRHYPVVLAAEQERVVTEGRLQTATGAFDTNLTAGQYLQDGSYPSNRTFVGASQPTPFHGATVFAGYRLGNGDFPTYYQDRLTAEGGEFRAGVILPLLRDREIDKRRAGVASASIDRALAEPNIHLQRVDVSRAATRAYWAWVAAGQRYHIANEVRNIARQRDQQLAKRVEAGNLAPIDRTDNQRIVAERQIALEQAARAYQAAAIALSLYLRDEKGAPVLPNPADVPWLHDPMGLPGPAQRAADLQLAYTQRPELARLALQREKLTVDLKLAQNQTLPGLNLNLTGAQDVGAGKSGLDRATYDASLIFDVPLQRNDARGRILAAQGLLAQVMFQEQLARDRVNAEVVDALSALERAYAVREAARENLRLATEVEQGERRTFQEGKSDLFRVNIRELQRAEAQYREVDALSEFYRALADYNAALGNDLSLATREK